MSDTNILIDRLQRSIKNVQLAIGNFEPHEKEFDETLGKLRKLYQERLVSQTQVTRIQGLKAQMEEAEKKWKPQKVPKPEIPAEPIGGTKEKSRCPRCGKKTFSASHGPFRASGWCSNKACPSGGKIITINFF